MTENDNLFHRAFLFLEDEDWEKADEYAEKILDGNPENSDAYLCKLLSELHVARKELLSDIQVEISQSKNYANALKFANASQKKFLEDCAKKAHDRVIERERIESHKEIIKTFSNLIDTYRDTQCSNREMIKRGKSATRMYLITYIIFIVYIATMILVSSLNLAGEYGPTVQGVGLGLGIPIFLILLWIGHARLVRFWNINYNIDSGWVFPFFFGMINAFFTLGIWGLVKAIKTNKECKGLSDNNIEMERQISDLQQEIEEKKELIQQMA